MMIIPVFISFFAISFVLGSWGDMLMKKLRREPALMLRLSFGGCLLILTGMASAFICGLMHLGVRSSAIIATLIVLSLGVSGEALHTRAGCRIALKPARIKLSGVMMTAFSVIIVAAQVYAVMFYSFENVRAMEGFGIATKVFESGRVYPADPMMLFVGQISNLSGIHPLRLIYTILPATLISFYYVCYAALIFEVTTGYRRFAAFVTVAVLNLFGYQSQVLIPAALLFAWSGTWVFVIHGLAAVAAVILTACMKSLPERTEEPRHDEDELSEEWDMKKHRIINARNLAIALGVLALVLVGTIFVLNSKINSLYAATVNLQEDLNSRCALYEFVPSGGGVEGYLLKGSDGTISFVGGGSSANADELGQFIAKFGTTVTRWYVYGEDEASSGAMRTLTSNGTIDAGKVFVISTDELTE